MELLRHRSALAEALADGAAQGDLGVDALVARLGGEGEETRPDVLPRRVEVVGAVERLHGQRQGGKRCRDTVERVSPVRAATPARDTGSRDAQTLRSTTARLVSRTDDWWARTGGEASVSDCMGLSVRIASPCAGRGRRLVLPE